MSHKHIAAAIIGGLIVIIVFSLFLFQFPGDTGKEEFEIIVENLDTVWAIDFLPDGSMIFTERPGKVSIYENGKVSVVGTIEVSEVSESGLAGVAVDPNFEENNFIYLYYTHEEGNRLSRFTLRETIEEELILLDNIPSARFHDGGRVKFGPDGLLYVTTGDATDPPSAQDLDSVAGKLLRINPDGSVPEDNPFDNLVYSYGHRNSQGLDWSEDGKLFSAEHGPSRNDEINIEIKGENYGWPKVQCDEVSEEYANPIRCFEEFTLAPSALAYDSGNLYVTGLRSAQIRKLILDETEENIIDEEVFISGLGRIREAVVHEGYLYFATSNRDGRGLPANTDDRILRIKL